MELPKINIGVTTYNRLALTRKCLASLKKYTAWPYVLTVVDNGSTDGTREFLTRLKADGLIDHLFLLSENMGVSCAANLAWTSADTPFFLKLDNDMEILSRDWLAVALGPMLRAGVAALVGPKIPGTSHPFEHTVLPGGETSLLALSSLSGAALFVPREAHVELGFFNEDYGLYGHEDADYSHRAKLAGYRLLAFDTEGIMRHLGAYRDGDPYCDFKSALRQDQDQLERIKPFPLNAYLFGFGLRELYVTRRLLPRIEAGGAVTFAEAPATPALRAFLEQSATFIESVPLDRRQEYTAQPECLARLREIRDRCLAGVGP